MNITAIIQARLGSTRLPQKVLLEIPKGSGISCLERVFRAVEKSDFVTDICLTTPDTELGMIAHNRGINYCVYHGRRNVVREYLVAADKMDSDIIVRITADCPMIQSEEIDRCIDEFIDGDYDLVYNTDESVTMDGDGTDVEIFSYNALNNTFLNAEGLEKEHVTLWMRRHLKCKYLPVSFYGCSLNNWQDYERICRLWNEKEESKVNLECSSGRDGDRLDKRRSS
jgi:spore coat polysaccharide biosynthesis protein SpsF (cytidylyltransferase family)